MWPHMSTIERERIAMAADNKRNTPRLFPIIFLALYLLSVTAATVIAG